MPKSIVPRLREGATRPLSAEQRGAISTALIELCQPESDADFDAMHKASRAIEAAIEGDLHPWRALQ